MSSNLKHKTDLVQLQSQLFSWLVADDEAIKSEVVGSDKAKVDDRLKIYSNAYRFRLIDALSDTFPSVHTLMGDDAFYEMSNAYIDAYPSHHFSLRYFGKHLKKFLLDFCQETPVLAEMAMFEWALRDSFDSVDIIPITLVALQEVPIESWGDIYFQFHPSVSRQDLNWNTPQLWTAIEEESDPIAPIQHEYPYAWALWRKELLTYYRSLDVDEAWALDRALEGGLFSDLCEGVCEWVDEVNAPARVAGFISQWIEDDLIVSLKIKD